MATLVSKDTSGCYIHPLGLPEAVGERTRSFKVWRNEPALDGRQRVDIAGQIGPIHYREDPFSETEQFKEIDLDVHLTPSEDWDAACETNGYQVRLWQKRNYSGKTLRYIAQFRRAGKWLAMAPVALVWENDAGQRQLISKPKAVGAPEIDNEANQVTWSNVFGAGLHFRYNLRPDEFFKTLIVQQKSDLPLPTIGGPGLRLTIVMALSWQGQSKAANRLAEGVEPTEPTDNISGLDSPDEQLDNPEGFDFKDELGRDTFWLRKPKAWDSYESLTDEKFPHSVTVDWRLRRKGSFVFALLSVSAAALNRPEVVYPVYIDTVMAEEQVAASTDDARNRGSSHPGDGGYDYDNTSNYLGTSSTLYYMLGLRFTPPIPQGVTIDSASISCCADGNSSADITQSIAAEDVDNAVTFALGSHEPYDSYVAQTTATATWAITTNWVAGTWYQSSDISTVAKEIVDRGGWVSSNGMVLVLWNSAAVLADLLQDVRSWNYAGNASGAKFNCSYTAAGGAVLPLLQKSNLGKALLRGDL